MALSHQSTDDGSRKFAVLLRLAEPWVLKSLCNADALVSGLLEWRRARRGVRVFLVEGQRMRTAQSFHDELVREVGLPNYYGRNFNALSECLTDPHILKGEAFIFLIRNGNQLLCEEKPEMLEGFLDTLKEAGAEWAVPVSEGQPWDRAAAPFHAIVQLQGEEPSILSMLPSFSI